MATSGRVRSTNSLADRLRSRIKQEGPITFYEWMSAALYDEQDGYYCRADRIPQGRAGDYRTAPETSPLFAATFANYFSKLFTDLKWPQSWTIFEAGSAGGEFAHGLLSSLRQYDPQIFAATNYVIDEISPAARQRATDRLAEFADRVTFRRLAEVVKPTMGIVFTNELIDALPVHRVIMRDGKLSELCVGLNRTDFAWGECDLTPLVAEYAERTRMPLDEGQIAEINLDAEDFVSQAAAMLDPGYVVTVDYGAERYDLWRSPNRQQGTLRAFRRHQFVDDVLAVPGELDLTTTIDWTQIREAGERAGLRTLRFERLDQFLLAEGLPIRLMDLSSTLDAVESIRLHTSARELVLPTGLAASFQVLVQEKAAQS
jgi:SAM-dependent MidA family methyltransferase